MFKNFFIAGVEEQIDGIQESLDSANLVDALLDGYFNKGFQTNIGSSEICSLNKG